MKPGDVPTLFATFGTSYGDKRHNHILFIVQLGIAMDCSLGFDSWQVQKIFLFSTQSRMTAHPTSYVVGTGSSFPGLKQLGLKAKHLIPSNGGALYLNFPTSSWHGA
jgi:hypothetical protein